ncbi:GspE/PulE family protein [Luminiphilus sp.]|nr:GspE/PulE family protein [Luminiphilus sp.]MDB2689032.1 GspE/PulE family protein [Luminiphilus sp.]
MTEDTLTEKATPITMGDRLVTAGLLSERDLERARLAKREMGCMLGEALVRLGLVAEANVTKYLAEELDVRVADKADYPEEPVIIESLPEHFLLNNSVVPLSANDESIVLSSLAPQDPFVKKALHLATGKNIELHLGVATDIETALERYTQTDEEEALDSFGAFDVNDTEFVEHLKDLASEAPVIQRVNQIIQRSLDIEASDVHLEHFDDGLRLRYRIDGVLQEASQIADTNLCAAIISRIKLLANLNIAERRLPQDGRIMMRVKGHELDLRVSTLPTVHGEGIVMRVLDRESIRLDLADMGFSEDIFEAYSELLKRPHGVLLLTGPTGSGKTTTLYASLSNMDSDSQKVITVEDPVEYQLHGINQIPVHSQIGLTFARALRSILRQDPDIIMIGEMRDTETAQIAVQSALTGHLVLSTLHTNTAAGAITRLEDMGVERFLITAAVNGVLAQRLIRKLCNQCKTATELPLEILKSTGLEAFMQDGSQVVYEAQGCEACKQTGYRGRIAIHELFVLDPGAQRAVLDGADAHQLREHARARGMCTLYEDGLRKVALGHSSLDEVLRVTQDQNEDPIDESHAA